MQDQLPNKTEIGYLPRDWDATDLGKLVVKIGSGITPKGGQRVYKSAGRPFLRSQNVGWGTLILDDIVFIDESTHHRFESTEIQNGDVFLNITGASIGRSAVANNFVTGGNVNQHVCIIRTDADRLLPKYLNYFLLSQKGQAQVDSFQAGGNRQGLNFGQIRAFKVALPPTKAEQTAIATVLSDADALITALEKLIEKKRMIKQGMMQELLSPGKEWEKVKLGEVASINRGGSPRPIERYLTNHPNGINWIKIGDVGRHAKYITSTEEKIMPEGVAFSRFVKEGDFLLSNSMSFGRPYILKTSGCIHDGWLVIQDYQSTFDTDFLYYILTYESTLHQYKAMAAGSSVLNLNKDIVRKVIVSLPQLKEQVRIAKVLGHMDEVIEVLEHRLNKAKLLKQGMMQELLTGKTRLT